MTVFVDEQIALTAFGNFRGVRERSLASCLGDCKMAVFVDEPIAVTAFGNFRGLTMSIASCRGFCSMAVSVDELDAITALGRRRGDSERDFSTGEKRGFALRRCGDFIR